MIRAETFATPIPGIRVSREVMLWSAITVVAAVLRFRDLGGRPLDPDEVRVALEAFRGVGFGRPWGSPESAMPGYTGLMSMVFFLFGSSDAAARLISGLAGAGLVGVCWLARRPVGDLGALGAAGLLTISPTLIEASRSALSGSLATALLLLFLLTVANILNALDRSNSVGSGWMCLLGVTLAAGLATDTIFALQLIALAAASVFAFDVGLIRARVLSVRCVPAWPLIVGFGLTVGIYTTRLGTNPGGLQSGLIDSLWMWVSELMQPGRIPLAPFLVLLGTECFVLVAALGGALGVGRASALERFAAAWLAITIAIAVIGGRVDFRLLAPVTVAAALLGGPWLARLAADERWKDPMTYLVGSVAAVPLIAALTASLPALRGSNAPPTQVIVAGIAGLAGAVIGAVALTGRRTTTHGLVFMILTLSLIGSVIGGARLSAASTTDLGRAAPGMVFASDLREVERQLAIWEWDQDRRTILVDDRLQGPLGWVLRSNRAVRWTPPEEVRSAPGVKLGSARGDVLPDRGLRVTIGYRFVGLTDLSPVRVAEWLLWRRSIPRVEPYDILLYR